MRMQFKHLTFAVALLGMAAFTGCSDSDSSPTSADQNDFPSVQGIQISPNAPVYVDDVVTLSPATVDPNNDEEIVASVGLPVVQKESGANQNGEPMTTYYFSEDQRNGLELSLSREFVDVAWKYDAGNAQKAYAVFDDGQRITRALLGGEIGAAIYSSIIKGSDIDGISFEDGTNVNRARCGESMCRYQVVR